MNLPNKLTVLRLFLTIFFVISLSVAFPYHSSVALLLFLLASFTDYLDGEIARRWQLITDFGKLMDPLADKILTAAAFICLAAPPYAAIPAWAVIVIISREFLITGLRLLASSKGIILPAEKLGKHKTLWQMITILFFLACLAIKDFQPIDATRLTAWMSIGGTILVSVTVILTFYSGLTYLWKNRHLLVTG